MKVRNFWKKRRSNFKYERKNALNIFKNIQIFVSKLGLGLG